RVGSGRAGLQGPRASLHHCTHRSHPGSTRLARARERAPRTGTVHCAVAVERKAEIMKSRTRSRARTPRAVIAAVAALATLSACSGSGSGGGDGGGEGGALAMAIPADEGCIDPQQLVGRSQLTVARSMVDSLVFQNDAEFEPWLATEWQVSDD